MTSIKPFLGISTICLVAGVCGAGNAQTVKQSRFALKDVQLLESPFLKAEQTDLSYMLKLKPERLLAPFLKSAGLVEKAKPYGNWESLGLDGHTAGHYLTALAQMFRSAGSMECKHRLDYMVSELARCQAQSEKGYVGGVPDGKLMFGELAIGNFNLFDKTWVPWYNLHKLFAGLRDAYLIAGNQQAKEVLIKLADWTDFELSKLSPDQIQRMLQMEYGGMNEVLADVYEITGNERYLSLAKKFCQPRFVSQLDRSVDSLTGLHANTQIPKIVGFEKIAQLNPRDTGYAVAARFFWNTVVHHRSISFGGNSVYEHFNPIDDFSSMIESVQGPETCNSYNMLKLTELLFLANPSSDFMDYYERCLYNHILSTQRTPEGGFVYFTPIRPREYRVYSTPEKDFWCCVGTGMENHGKYGEMIYTHQSDSLYVNLFIASRLRWEKQQITLTQQNKFPYEEQSMLSLQLASPKVFSVFIRKPSWLQGKKLNIRVDGKEVAVALNSEGYVELRRKWRDGDNVLVELPMKNELDRLPDNSNWVSIRRGPVVLAAVSDTTDLVKTSGDGGRFDHIAPGPLYDLSQSPVLLLDSAKSKQELNQALEPVKGQPLHYTIPSIIAQSNYKRLKLVPFYEVQDDRYMLYWPFTHNGGLSKMQKLLSLQDHDVLVKSWKTVDHVAPGEQQPETDHQLVVRNSETGSLDNRHWRAAHDGYFSYMMNMTPDVKAISITYLGLDRNVAFDILIGNFKLATVKVADNKVNEFITRSLPIPESLRKTGAVKVSFVADGSRQTARIFDIRLTK